MLARFLALLKMVWPAAYQLLIVELKERVAHWQQGRYPMECGCKSPVRLKGERGDRRADGENPCALRDFCHQRGHPRPGGAAHPGNDEDQIEPLQGRLNFV